MGSRAKRKKNARRPCLESLHLPIPRPSSFKPGSKNAHILPHTLSSSINPPPCHCLQDECSGHFCDSFDDCMILDSCNESDSEDDIDGECSNDANDRETTVEGNETGELFLLGDRWGRESSSERNKSDSRIGKTPVSWSSNTNNNEYDNLIHQQANQTSSQVPLNRDDVQDLESTENNSIPVSHSPLIQFRNKDYLLVNNSDNTGVSEAKPAEPRNRKSFGIHFNKSNNEQIDDKIHSNDNQGLFDIDVKENDLSQLQQNLDRTYNIGKGSYPNTRDIKSTSTIPQRDNNKTLHNDYLNRDVHPANDISNPYYLPSCIQVQTTSELQGEVNCIRNTESPLLSNLTEYNSNDYHDNDLHQSRYKFMAETHNEQINDRNILSDKQSDEVRSDRRNVSDKSTQTSKLYQSRQMNHFDDTPSRNNSSVLQESSKKPERSHSTHSQENFWKDHSLCQSKSKLIRRTSKSSDSNTKIDFQKSSSGLANRRGPECCRENIGNSILKKKGSRYGTNKISLDKDSNVDCACSKYYERIKLSYEKELLKKGSCNRKIGSSTCSSASCIMNQNPGCLCRYPPSYKHLSCAGNITGTCCCSINNHE